MPRNAAVRGALVALMIVLLAPTVSASEQETFYLGTDGFPRASLIGNPLGGELPNFDRGRDIEPGLLLEISSLGLAETDDRRFQHWQVEASGRHIIGFPEVVIWGAPAGFDAGKSGALAVFLLDCDAAGTDCVELGSAEATIRRGEGGTWVENRLGFEPIDHTFGELRYLGVRAVVTEESGSEVMLAYGYPKQRSRLTIYSEAPPPAEGAAVADEPPMPASQELKAKLHPVASDPGIEVARAPDPDPTWPWLTALAASTVMLVALGWILVQTLTRPGRHEDGNFTTEAGSVVEGRVPVSVG